MHCFSPGKMTGLLLIYGEETGDELKAEPTLNLFVREEVYCRFVRYYI